jgi:gluconate 2-dehydrogenase gamma chain
MDAEIVSSWNCLSSRLAGTVKEAHRDDENPDQPGNPALQRQAGGEAILNKQDVARREFLTGAALGAGVVAGARLLPEAAAQAQPQAAAATVPAYPHMHTDVDGHGAFFNDADAETVAAFAERLMPGAPEKPGARDAGVLNYIDLALAGAYADLQDFYRRGLAQLDAYCRNTHGEPFSRLDAARQDEVIKALEDDKAGEFTWPTAQAFFNTVRTHTMEGMFADPIYGGNKDFAGWRLIGFPGAQPLFTPEDLESAQAFTREPIVGLQGRA